KPTAIITRAAVPTAPRPPAVSQSARRRRRGGVGVPYRSASSCAVLLAVLSAGRPAVLSAAGPAVLSAAPSAVRSAGAFDSTTRDILRLDLPDGRDPPHRRASVPIVTLPRSPGDPQWSAHRNCG